jgi:putative membrane protein
MTFALIVADSGSHMWGWGGGMMFGWVFMTVLLIGGGALVYAVARGPGRPRNESTALDVLDARYARGEIGRDEYLERRSDLER